MLAILFHQRESNSLKATGILLTVILIMAGLFVGCGGSEQRDEELSSRVINVVTTTGMISDAVENVGGSRLQVTGLMGPGVDPHLYKASAGDVTRMQEADIVFYNGLHLEGAMSELFEKMQHSKLTVAVGDGIDVERLLTPPQFQGMHDPHVWFDVTLWADVVRKIESTLVTADSAHAAQYHENAAAYIEKLEKLDEYVRALAAEVPESLRVIVTAHDAFNYMGRAYGFEVRGLQGISTASEAGTKDVQDLSDFIAQRRIPAIFVESSIPRRAIEALQAAVEAKGFAVVIGGELFSDAMGDPGTPEGTYIGMVKHNIETIVHALTGKAE